MLSAATACSATKVSGSSTPYSARTGLAEQPAQRILRKQGKAAMQILLRKRPGQTRQALDVDMFAQRGQTARGSEAQILLRKGQDDSGDSEDHEDYEDYEDYQDYED